MGSGGAAATIILNLNAGRKYSRHTYRAATTLILNLNGGPESQPPRLSST